jgi:branched-chain amino acid transport system ATP-binding protein
VNCLAIEGLTVRFGGLVAVDELNLSVDARSIQSLIGPNGAGKTTVINAIMGLCPTAQGSIRFQGQEILGAPAHMISRAGIARSFQNIEVFPEMTVFENVLVGAHSQVEYGSFSAMLRTRAFRAGERTIVEHANRLLKIIGMQGETDILAGSLPFGKQRLLELARALASNPKLLLLDEPAAGLRAIEIDALNDRLVKLRDEYNLTILLVDHAMQVVMNISDRVTVLNFGCKIAEGSADTVRADPQVQQAYLGDRSVDA